MYKIKVLWLIVSLVSLANVFISSCTGTNNKTNPEARIEQEMILIPAAEYTMGVDGDAAFSPAHKVKLDSFYIDKYEVTNAMYSEFMQATEARTPEFWGMEEFHSGLEFPDHPVVGIGWGEAGKYAKWAGKRLPTEAEWEYAAKGGLIGMKYAYGDSADTLLANFSYKGRQLGTTPVGSYPPNGFGLHDMTGNVREFVSDYYSEEYYANSPFENPQGPEKGRFRVIRDGGWHSGAYCTRVFERILIPSDYWRDLAVGFRCARDVHPDTVAAE